ncbi:hypothetical protein MASR2M47_39070 [Draconibacterium sp.]
MWLLVPSEKEAPKVEAKVVSKNESEIKLQVAITGKGSWMLTIPFSNSRNAKLEFVKISR